MASLVLWLMPSRQGVKIIPAGGAKEAFELSVMGYRQGRGSWPHVQIAQRNYFRMSTEYVEALAELRRSELVILGLLMDGPEEAPAQK